MAKTLEKTELTLQVDPRVRMKEIRKEVASYFKKNPDGLNHLGELPTNIDDAYRVIIAVQDLLEKEKEKHRKANAHIIDWMQIANSLAEFQEEAMDYVKALQAQLDHQSGCLEAERKYNYGVREVAEKAGRERDAMLITMKLLNGQRD